VREAFTVAHAVADAFADPGFFLDDIPAGDYGIPAADRVEDLRDAGDFLFLFLQIARVIGGGPESELWGGMSDVVLEGIRRPV